MGLFDDLPDPPKTSGMFDDLPDAKSGMFDDLPDPQKGSVLGDIGRAIADVPLQFKAAVAAALEGKDPFAARDWKDLTIEEARQRDLERAAEPGGEDSFLGISRQDIRDLPKNLAFSLTSAGAGLATGIPAGAASLNPLVGYGVGGAASGVAAYRMDANQFIRTIRQSMDEESLNRLGRPITDDEWKAVEPRILDAAHTHGMFEAVPEAIGNVAGLKIIVSPLRGMLGRNVLTRVAGKLAGMYGTEFATETVTQMGQQQVESGIGLTEEPPREWTSGADWMQSLKEIAPQTFLLTTIMGTGGMLGHQVYQSLKGEKTLADVVTEAAAENQIDKVPDNELEAVVANAEEVLSENPDNERLGEAVASMKTELDRRKVERPEAFATMAPTPEPVMEGETLASWAPGKEYKGMITDTESAARAIPQPAPVEGGLFRTKESLVRREKIIKKLSSALGYPVYQGRIKKARRELGFYKPRTDEVRIRNRNDIEVAAHEIAHLLDYTEQTFRKGYHRKEFVEEVRGLSYDKKKLFEGFAEFVRHWMTNEPYAREKAPKFTAWFEETLKGHKHEKAIRTAKDEMHAWYSQGLLKQAQSKIGADEPTLTEKFEQAKDRWLDKLIASVFDAFHGLKVAELDLRKGTTDLPAYMAVRLMAGMRMTTRAIYERGTVNWRPNGDLYFTGPGLRDVFAGVADNMDDAMTYFAMRRASELMSQGREHLFTPGQIEAGLALGETRPEFKVAFEKWQAFNQRMLDFVQTSGVISDKTRANLDAMNRDYVPFYRIIEEVTGQVKPTGRRPFSRLVGGTGNVKEIMENITTNVALLTEAAIRNQAKQQIYNLVGSSKGGAKYAARIPPEQKVTWVDTQQVIKKMQELGVPQIPDAKDLEPIMTFYTFGHPPKGANVDVVLYEGKPVYFEVADPLFLRAVQAFGIKPVSLVMRIMGGFKTLLTRLVTSSLDFMMVNTLRDTLSSFMLTKTGFKPGIDSVKGMVSRLQKDAAYWEAMANGIGFATFTQGEGAALRHRTERFYTKHKINMQSVIDSPLRLLELWDDVTSASEYAARLGEYERARAQGKTARQAAFYGRDISTDFAMHGSSDFVRIFTGTVPFFGARLQGIYRLLRAAATGTFKATAEGESPTRLALKGGILLFASVALYLLNRDDERYKQLPNWVRDLHWVILPPGSDRAYLIPKPFELGVFFGSIPERMTELAIEQNGEKFGKALGWILMNQLEVNPTPQIVKPALDLLMNRNWTGSPIVPEDLKDVEDWAQYRPWTSDTMVALGKATNMSPMQLEALFKGYFGTIGIYTLMMSDTIFETAQGKVPIAKRAEDYIGFRRFTRDFPLRYTQQQEDFYDLSKEVTTVVATYNKLLKEGDAEGVTKYLEDKERQTLYGSAQTMDQIKAIAATLNSELRLIQLDNTRSPEEKRKQMNELLRQQAELFRQSVEGFEAAGIR